MIYKDKNIKNNIVLEETKIKTDINDIDEILNILKLANFQSWASLEDACLAFECEDKRKSIVVGDVKDLGLFIEVESSEKELKPEERIKELKKFLDSLGLDYDKSDYSVKKAYKAFKRNK